jgi:hypothetical protein
VTCKKNSKETSAVGFDPFGLSCGGRAISSRGSAEGQMKEGGEGCTAAEGGVD